MRVSLMLAGAVLALAAPALSTPVLAAPAPTLAPDETPRSDRVDVAFAELRSGENRAAVDKIRASRLDSEGDPAALINLGSAYARLGQRDAARDCYRDAIVSRERYEVQLSDGSWVDSRRAARMAIDALSQNRMLTLR